MELAPIVDRYFDRYVEQYSNKVLPGHLNAFNSISRCRTEESGEVYVWCPKCKHSVWHPLSCGNRHCPKCQNHETSAWLDKQEKKLLPVTYFMVTFTLPFELRPLAWSNQKTVYSMLFNCASDTLKGFGLNPDNLGAEIGMTMMLHTNARNLDFHPHVHAIVPGGGIDKRKRQWKSCEDDYLFHEQSMAKVFRAKLLDAINKEGLLIPKGVPEQWIAHCESVGRGISALQYLSRYLYRGVISEKNIVAESDGMVTFKYKESKTGETKFRTVTGERFLYLISLHVLPKGFRRVRDYGFLHSNARKLLSLIQLVLRVVLQQLKPRPRPVFKCPCCQASMVIIKFKSYDSGYG